MKIALALIVFLFSSALSISAETLKKDMNERYSYQTMRGEDMICYRVAAVHFFKKDRIEDCVPLERGFQVQFTRRDSDPGVVTITFVPAAAAETPQFEAGGGSTNYVVDLSTYKIVRIYGSR